MAQLAALATARTTTTTPAVNQCQMSVGSHDDATLAYCQRHNVTYEAYSPLRRVNMSDPRIAGVAAKHNATAAQVALRWVHQRGAVIATSPGENLAYIAEDLDIGGLVLDAQEMAALNSI